jgi:hypothetical protein
VVHFYFGEAAQYYVGANNCAWHCLPSSSRLGVPNKATAKREAKIAASGLTPLDYLLGVFRDEQRNPDERLKAATAAAPYVHPRLATVEV